MATVIDDETCPLACCGCTRFAEDAIAQIMAGTPDWVRITPYAKEPRVGRTTIEARSRREAILLIRDIVFIW